MPILVVQMGHSGRTSGATGAPGEMAFAEAVGAACLRLLNGLDGWKVRLIPADVSTSAYIGDAFVAIHADGSSSPDVRGASIGYQTIEGRLLAEAWAANYRERGWAGPWNPDNYTANLAQYYGVRNAMLMGNRRAFIAECGTITNPAERDAMTSPEGVDRVALAVGDALGIAQPDPTPEQIPTEEEDVIAFVTCLSPNQSAVLLSGGRVVDITSDSKARSSAQNLINAERVVEWMVSAPTFDALKAGA